MGVVFRQRYPAQPKCLVAILVKVMNRNYLVSVKNLFWLSTLVWLTSSCNPCGTTKPNDIELRVNALNSRVFALSTNNQYHGFYGPNDTIDLDSIAEWYVQLTATGPQIAWQPTARWSFFPQAVACEPVPPYVFTRQTARGLQAFTSAALNTQYPAGSAIGELFYTSPRLNEGWRLDVEIAQHGMGRLLNGEWSPLSYFLRTTPNPGTISQFTFELYIDNDTLRSATPFIRF